MRLLHGPSGRVIEDGALLRRDNGDTVLVAEKRVYTPLEASDERLTLLDATDVERRTLVEAGYALPSHVPSMQDDDDGA